MLTLILATAACAQGPSPAEAQFQRGLDLCARFVGRQLDDSIQYYGDQVGFRVTDDFMVQRWTDPENLAAWIEVEANGRSMQCDVRASKPVMSSTKTAVEAVFAHLGPRGYRQTERQTQPAVATWVHGMDGGLATLMSTQEVHSIAFRARS